MPVPACEPPTGHVLEGQVGRPGWSLTTASRWAAARARTRPDEWLSGAPPGLSLRAGTMLGTSFADDREGSRRGTRQGRAGETRRRHALALASNCDFREVTSLGRPRNSPERTARRTRLCTVAWDAVDVTCVSARLQRCRDGMRPLRRLDLLWQRRGRQDFGMSRTHARGDTAGPRDRWARRDTLRTSPRTAQAADRVGVERRGGSARRPARHAVWNAARGRRRHRPRYAGAHGRPRRRFVTD